MCKTSAFVRWGKRKGRGERSGLNHHARACLVTLSHGKAVLVPHGKQECFIMTNLGFCINSCRRLQLTCSGISVCKQVTENRSCNRQKSWYYQDKCSLLKSAWFVFFDIFDMPFEHSRSFPVTPLVTEVHNGFKTFMKEESRCWRLLYLLDNTVSPLLFYLLGQIITN